MSHLPSVTGCPWGAGPMGHSLLHEVPYTGKRLKEIDDKLNKEGILTTQIASVPFYRCVREGVDPGQR